MMDQAADGKFFIIAVRSSSAPCDYDLHHLDVTHYKTVARLAATCSYVQSTAAYMRLLIILGSSAVRVADNATSTPLTY
jgi:hypothetical protein